MAVGMDQGVAGLAPRLFTLEEETGSHHGQSANNASTAARIARPSLCLRTMPLFGRSKKNAQRLDSSGDMGDRIREAQLGARFITLHKSKGRLALTFCNVPDGTDGVVVHSIGQVSIAPAAGLQVGDVILSVNQHLVANHAGAVQLIDNATDEIVLGLAATGRPTSEHPELLKRESSSTFALDESSQKGLVG